MSLVKYANIEQILEVKQTPSRLDFAYGQEPGTSLSKFAALSDHKENDGYLYVKCRAISSRVNKNNDGWPSEELARAYSTFVGRPVFVDHNNDDPKRTRGVIVDSKLHVDDEEKTSALDNYYSSAPDNHKPPTWIELLIEVDAKTFPHLAKSIRNKDIDSVSMGANIDKSVCSVCAHEASTPNEYCDHIKKKGITFEITADNGEKQRKKSYEDCFGVNFFEISFVFDPADTTALIDKVTHVDKTAIDADTVMGLGLGGAALKGLWPQIKGFFDQLVGQGTPPEQAAQEAINHVTPEHMNQTPQAQADYKQMVMQLMQEGPPMGADTRLNHVAKTAAPGDPGGLPTNLPVGLLDDLWVAVHPQKGGEEGISQAVQNGDLDHAHELAGQLSTEPIMHGNVNPFFGVAPEHIVQQIQQNVQTMNPGATPPAAPPADPQTGTPVQGDPNQQSQPVGRVGAQSPIDSFIEPVGTEHDKQDDSNYVPQSDMITAPQQVDTLREETRCPVCRAADLVTDPDNIQRCPVCGHIQEPEPLNNPDLGVARETDLAQGVSDMKDPQGNPEVPVPKGQDATDQIEISPINPISPVSARNQGTSRVGISDMKDLFKTLSIETTLGGDYGIHKGTSNNLRGVASVKVTFPTIKHAENSVTLPDDNPIFAFFLAQEAAARDKIAISEVPIIVEPVIQGVGDLHEAVAIIRATATLNPRVAASLKKTPIINSPVKATDEPKGAKILSDELKPRQSDVTVERVQIGDKSYNLTPVDEEEELKDQNNDDEKNESDTDDKDKESKTADRRHIIRSEQDANGVVRSEEITEEMGNQEKEEPVAPAAQEQQPFAVAAVEEEKEVRLLASMKIADEAVDMGLLDKQNKMVYIAELEEKSKETLDSISETLELVKSAGLSKSRVANLGLRRVPRLAHSNVPFFENQSNGNGTQSDDPDFLWGVE